MGMFAYIARDAAGERITGKLAGSSEQSVLAELHARELSPIRVDEVRQRAALSIGRRRLSSRKLANLYRQLADLLRAGVPLLRSLRLLAKSKQSSDPVLGRTMGEIADLVADGERLAEAMHAQAIFPEVHIAMVRAGEAGGFLEDVLARLGEFLEHQADMKSKIIGNLIYPMVLLALATCVIAGALILFVPKFRPMFEKLETLPLPTRILLGASDALTQHTLWVALGLAALVAGAVWMLRQPNVRRGVIEFVMKVPRVGAFTSNLAVARFARILGTMLENGIPMLAAMKVSRDAAGHPVLADAIDDATEAVRAGEPLAGPLASSGMVADDVVEMIAVGEQANNLPAVLITISETLEKRIDRALQLMLRLMEPLLLLMLAGVVVFIFIALFMPMLQMSTAIGR